VRPLGHSVQRAGEPVGERAPHLLRRNQVQLRMGARMFEGRCVSHVRGISGKMHRAPSGKYFGDVFERLDCHALFQSHRHTARDPEADYNNRHRRPRGKEIIISTRLRLQC